jgi:hypothetical protein
MPIGSTKKSGSNEYKSQQRELKMTLKDDSSKRGVI